MLIRICTEDKNPEQVQALCAKHFDGFTIYRAQGIWKGQTEPSLIIEIAVLSTDTFPDEQRAFRLATQIKSLNQQEAVLIEYLESKNELI